MRHACPCAICSGLQAEGYQESGQTPYEGGTEWSRTSFSSSETGEIVEDRGAQVSRSTSGNSVPRSRRVMSANGGPSGDNHLTQQLRSQQHIQDTPNANGQLSDDTTRALIIANNLELLHSPQYSKLKLAFDDWSKDLELFQRRGEKRDEDMEATWNKMYQVIGFYVIFQGVIVTVVAQASALRCQNCWTSTTLSCLMTIATMSAVFRSYQELKQAKSKAAFERETVKILRKRINHVKFDPGPREFNFSVHAKDNESTNSREPKPSALSSLFFKILVLIVFGVFSLLVIVCSCLILCHPGRKPPE